MHKLKMSAVHGPKFFSGETKACGVQTTVQGRGEGFPEPDTTTKNDDISCSFSSKAKFQIMHGAHAMHGARRRARDRGQCTGDRVIWS